MGSLKIRRALISVSDKSGLEDLATFLHQQGIEILSTGGTYQVLKAAGIPALEVSSYTNFPEIMDGRVKTLHPLIYGGILARRGQDDECLKKHKIHTIDLVVVNLYDFQRTISNPDCSLPEAIENIDIGGPSMIRAAAKNYQYVLVAVEPQDYSGLQERIEKNKLDKDFRKYLAAKAFAHTSRYDQAITTYLSPKTQSLPETVDIHLKKIQDLRYGENPHQRAAFYSDREHQGFAEATLHQGKQLSYNNLADANAAYHIVTHLAPNSCCIVKHANPCGASTQQTQLQSYIQAYNTDPESSFGGIVAFNNELEEESTQAILKRGFIEVIIAPSYSDQSLKILTQKPNIRVLEVAPMPYTGIKLHNIAGGILVQDADCLTASRDQMQIAGKIQPTEQQWHDLLFAWQIVRHVKSNAIVYSTNQTTLGIGAGQMSRVNSARIAHIKANHANLSLKNAVMASDAFFPFRDSIDTAAHIGISAIIHPGGSIRDKEVIQAADEHGIALVATNFRHFKH